MMFNWRRKNRNAHDELLSQINEVNQMLQQVVEENKRLKIDVKVLQEKVEAKDYQLAEA